jgi:hypothetical protein
MASGIRLRSELCAQSCWLWLTSTRQFGTMAEKVQDYESLLRELAARVGEQDAELIQKALEKVFVPLTGGAIRLIFL